MIYLSASILSIGFQFQFGAGESPLLFIFGNVEIQFQFQFGAGESISLSMRHILCSNFNSSLVRVKVIITGLN